MMASYVNADSSILSYYLYIKALIRAEKLDEFPKEFRDVLFGKYPTCKSEQMMFEEISCFVGKIWDLYPLGLAC
jgi:hypothetical protein